MAANRSRLAPEGQGSEEAIYRLLGISLRAKGLRKGVPVTLQALVHDLDRELDEALRHGLRQQRRLHFFGAGLTDHKDFREAGVESAAEMGGTVSSAPSRTCSGT